MIFTLTYGPKTKFILRDGGRCFEDPWVVGRLWVDLQLRDLTLQALRLWDLDLGN